MKNIVYGSKNLGIAILLEGDKSFHLSLHPIRLSAIITSYTDTDLNIKDKSIKFRLSVHKLSFGFTISIERNLDSHSSI